MPLQTKSISAKESYVGPLFIPQTVLTVGVLTVLVEGPMDPPTRRSRCGAADFIDFYNTNSMSPSKTPQFLKKLMEMLQISLVFTMQTQLFASQIACWLILGQPASQTAPRDYAAQITQPR